MNAIVIEDLKKYYGKTRAVDGISLEIEKGEIFGFLGPNGAGKTTTIRCMMDFLRPTAGTISIHGFDSRRDSVKSRANIGYLSGDVSLYAAMTGDDHIRLVEAINGKSKIAADLIRRLDFNPEVKAKNLSSGNQQKLGLIIALMSEPPVLILDEPTVGLDPLLQNKIYEILKEFRDNGSTIFISSHNLPEVEKICDKAAIIKAGRIIATEDIRSLKEKKVFSVRIHFDGPFKERDFTGEGVEIGEHFDNSVTLKVKKDINEILKVLTNYNILDLEITHASLEDIFLEFYK